jgi:hypothetical protein
MGLMLSQLLSDNTGPGILKSILEHKDLYFLRTIPFRHNHPYRYVYYHSRARRRLEAFIRTFFHHQNRMSLIDRVKVVEEMFTDLLSITVKLSDCSDQYLKYKVADR